MTDNDVVDTNPIYKPAAKNAINSGNDSQSLKVSSSFHPIEYDNYNLWLNDGANLNFFKPTENMKKKATGRIRKLKGVNPSLLK